MIPRTLFTEELRRLGYRYKTQTDRMMIFRERGGVNRVLVRRMKLLDEQYVRIMLRQIGQEEDAIEAFLNRSRHADTR